MKPYMCPLESFLAKLPEPTKKLDFNHDAYEELQEALEDEKERVEMRQHQYEESCKRRKELLADNTKLRQVLTSFAKSQTDNDKCGVCELTFDECEKDFVCHAEECPDCIDDFVKQCRKCEGKMLLSDPVFECPGAHARAALK
jgi:hypothetical protein